MKNYFQEILRWKLFWFTLLVGLFLDQITKFWSITIWQNQPMVLVENWLRLIYSENYGIAFGMAVPFLVLVPASIILLMFFLHFMQKELEMRKKWSQVFVGMVVSGGIGNLLDRLIHGFVVDFISVGGYPIFNLADVWIVVGAIGALVFYGKLGKK